jgi:hypothetical protein
MREGSITWQHAPASSLAVLDRRAHVGISPIGSEAIAILRTPGREVREAACRLLRVVPSAGLSPDAGQHLPIRLETLHRGTQTCEGVSELTLTAVGE